MSTDAVRAANQRALETAKRNVETCEGTLEIAQRDLAGTAFVDQSLRSLARAKKNYVDLYQSINGHPEKTEADV